MSTLDRTLEPKLRLPTASLQGVDPPAQAGARLAVDEEALLEALKDRTRDFVQRADAKRFAAKCATVQDVSKEDVQWWTAALIQDGLTPKTGQRIVSALRG